MTLIQDLHHRIDNMEDTIAEYARSLVRFPSTAGNEAEAQQYVKDCMTALNCTRVDLWHPDYDELKDHEAFICERSSFENSPNVVGTWRGTGGGKSLILNSHIDIVPEGDMDAWTYTPFGGDMDNGNVYGRGVSDMKGSKAAIFAVIKALQDAGVSLKGDLIVQSVIEEETGGLGTLACALRGYKADAAIVPEPTGFKLCPAQQGSTWFRMTVTGKAAHAGTRYLGVSAIEKSVPLLDAIARFETYLNTEYASELYRDAPIAYAVNVGTISGGVWASMVPEKIVIEGRVGIPPQITLKQGWKLFEDWIRDHAAKDPWLADHQPEIQWFGSWWGPASIDTDHPIIACAQRGFSSVLPDQPPSVIGAPFATDGRMLTEFADTPALVFGPGTSAHCPDEFMPLKDLVTYAKMLATIVVDWCGV